MAAVFGPSQPSTGRPRQQTQLSELPADRPVARARPLTPSTRACDVTRYVIRVMGHLDAQWSEWFDGLVITPSQSGNTVLSGDIVDQAALHGTLNKIRDLNLPLISVTAAGPGSHSYRPNGA